MTRRINLISGPRNISTALMYSWANRIDTTVIDEPMYAYYLSETKIDYHPGTAEILNDLPHKMGEVIDSLMLKQVSTPLYFIKGMAHHYINIDLSFLLDFQNVFLVRDPKQLIASFSKVIERPTMQDIGLKREWEIYNFLISQGKRPIVLDSNQVLAHPTKTLSLLCKHLEVPFDEAMLSWEAGPIPEDGIWAKYWYESVWKSIGWAAPDTSTRKLSQELFPLYEEALIYYNRLRSIGDEND